MCSQHSALGFRWRWYGFWTVKDVWSETCFRHVCQCRHPSSWHISVSIACVWLTDAPWARRGSRPRSKYARGNGQVRLHVWDELARKDWQRRALAQSDSNHTLTSFSPVSLAPAPLSPVRHAWLPRVTRVFTSRHTRLLTVNMTCIRSGTLTIVTSVLSVRSWYERIHTDPICHRGWSASFPF